MSKDNVGGAAFPTPNDPMYLGMTLRDYFAALAMPSLMAHNGGHWSEHSLKHYAIISYRMADAMLKERDA